MEYLNDEMDDLFRKAGEHYPLKTSDSDWDAVLGRLQPAEGDQSLFDGQIPEKRSNKNRRLFWLLLLLPLGLFSVKYFSGRNNENKSNGIADQVKPPVLTSTDQKTATALQPGKTDRPASSALLNEKNKKNRGNALTSPTDASKLKTGSALNNRAAQEFSAGNNLVYRQKVKASLSHKNAAANDNTDQSLLTDQQEEFTADVKANPSAAGSSAADPAIASGDNAAKDTGNARDNNAISTDMSAQSALGKDSARLLAKDKKSKNPVKPAVRKERGIYISVLAGPDFSTVKFQNVKNMGYSVGLLAGYRFNKHISVESGLYWDKKQYYSEGKYFNKSKTNIPSSVQIKDLDGDCSMFEIPVSFRYDFSFSKKGRFFATGGLNSYIMKKENYDYSTQDYPGWSRKVSYNNSVNNLFSILQVSAGYEYKLGKIGSIRVEPYLNIPLKGVGIGSMPISSAGLHLGITIPFR